LLQFEALFRLVPTLICGENFVKIRSVVLRKVANRETDKKDR